MASNRDTLADVNGDSADWIEIHNPTAEPISLSGWSLTDDPNDLRQWRFPDVRLDAGSYLVVFASGKGRPRASFPFTSLTQDFHTTTDGTFVIDLPDGTYEVRMLMGDSDRLRDLVEIRIEGELVNTLTTQAGQLGNVSYRTEVSEATGGQHSVWLKDLGGETKRAAINGLEITPSAGGETLLFDFGLPASPVAPDYRSVVPTDTYSPQTGYGWLDGAKPSGQDRATQLHTNFSLDAQGEYVALVSPEGIVVSEFSATGATYPRQARDVSYGRIDVAPDAQGHYFSQPTPGEANATASVLTGIVADTTLSVDRGFYDEAFDVEITTSTPGATIVYTTDGGEPLSNVGFPQGTMVDPPDAETPPVATVHIDKTTVLRAVAIKDGNLPTHVDSHTYLFLDDVVRQENLSVLKAGFPNRWNGTSADYGFNARVIGQDGQDKFGGLYAHTIREDLKTIPTMSLVLNNDDMFGANGIYANPGERGAQWERPVSVEYIDPNTGDEFHVDAGIRLQGGGSRRRDNKKHSLRLIFKDAYGPPKLKFPLYGEDAAEIFDSIVLRANYNDSWFFPTPRGSVVYTRDSFGRRSQLAMGQSAPHGRFVHLYINGLYWGLYNPTERPDENFSANYFGGEKAQWDVVNGDGLVAGTVSPWQTMNSLASDVSGTSTEAARTAAFQRIQGKNPDGIDSPELPSYLDVDNYIDYLMVNFYVGNRDWPVHNFYASRQRGSDSTGFKFFAWDLEAGLGRDDASTDFRRLNVNMVGANTGVAAAFGRLRTSEEFRMQFADHVHQYFFNGGALTPDVSIARFKQISNEVDRAIVAESARWGDLRSPLPLTRDVDWVFQRNWILNTYLPQRSDIVLEQFRNTKLYPRIGAPEFAMGGHRQHGGPIELGTGFTIDDGAQPGVTIYYTLNGQDPRQIGGALRDTARSFQPGVDPPITLSETTLVKARIRDASGEWSALSETLFDVHVPLDITELNFNPYDPTTAERTAGFDNNDDFEFVELMNAGSQPLNLKNYRFVDGIEFTFEDTTLAAGEYVLVVKNQSAFEARYGNGHRLAGEFSSGRLSNAGETIRLEDPHGVPITEFTYDDQPVEMGLADGNGTTLEVIDPNGDYNVPENWRTSSEFGGSPGRRGRGPTRDVLINEVLARSEGANADLIELYNTTSHAIDLSGWHLSDDGNDLRKRLMPIGTTIGAGQYLVLSEAEIGFSLDGRRGEAIWLIQADRTTAKPLRIADYVPFDATQREVSLGRWPDGDPHATLVPLVSQTFGAPNHAPRAGEVVISEIHYNPTLARFQHDFSTGATEDFTPISGTWQVADGQYQVTPGTEAGSDTISILPLLDPLSSEFEIGTQVNIPSGFDFSRNAAIIFDYQGPTDFKFASLHAGLGRWRIGRRDESGWNFLADIQESVALDTDYDVSVKINGTMAQLLLEGVPQTMVNFGTPLSDGLIGLGSKKGKALFGHITVRPLVDQQAFEFVELSNPTQDSIELEGWQLSGGIELTFAAGTTIGAGESLVVVRFDPAADRSRGEEFRRLMGIDTAVSLVGPYDGKLDNDGETVHLMKPEQTGDRGAGPFLVDQVGYDNQMPWPAAADESDKSLSRLAAHGAGDLASSWAADDPSPGSANLVPLGDVNFDGKVDTGDIVALVLALNDPAAYERLYSVPAMLNGDVDRDGDVDFDDIDDFVRILEA